MRPIDGDILLEQFRALRDKWGTENAIHRAVRGALVDCILCKLYGQPQNESAEKILRKAEGVDG